MKDVVIVSAKRTPIGSYLGALSGLSAVDLGVAAVQAALDSAGVDPNLVDSLVFGNVLAAGSGQNIARQVAIGAGIPNEKTANIVSMVCGSGMKSVMDAANQIRVGDADIVVAGGTESMSNAPHTLHGLRSGQKMGHSNLIDTMLCDGLTDAFGDYHMGMTAENLAKQFSISRHEQDSYAVQSQARAESAITSGRFVDEIAPVSVQVRRKEVCIEQDEYPKFGTTLDAVGALRPAFVKDGSGTVTAANASGLNDGAAALVLMSREKAGALGLTPLATIASQAAAGVDPEVMGYGPVPASRIALKRAGLTVDDLDLVEANEAFASQALTVCQELHLDPAKTNVNGGAIALGHPIGASGARILVTLIHEIEKRKADVGLATLCIGGGQGLAVIVKRWT